MRKCFAIIHLWSNIFSEFKLLRWYSDVYCVCEIQWLLSETCLKCRYNNFPTQHRWRLYKINMHTIIYSRGHWSCYPTIQNLNRWRRVWICLSWHFAWWWGSGCKGPFCHIYPGNAGIWKWGAYENPYIFFIYTFSVYSYLNFLFGSHWQDQSLWFFDTYQLPVYFDIH